MLQRTRNEGQEINSRQDETLLLGADLILFKELSLQKFAPPLQAVQQDKEGISTTTCRVGANKDPIVTSHRVLWTTLDWGGGGGCNGED